MVMAEDGDRDRGRRRRRRGGRKEYERDFAPPPGMPSKPPIILAKPQSDKPIPVTITNGPDPPLVTTQNPTNPPILLKSREDSMRHESRAQPNLNGSVPNLPGILGSDISAYSIQKPPVSRASSAAGVEMSSQTRLARPPQMVQSIKLVDESMNWCEAGMEMLMDQNHFLVVGVLGMQGVGKSTILSYLAGNNLEESKRQDVFAPAPRDAREVCGHETFGIDMYVTGERTIFLDCQPLLSPSLLYHMIQQDKKYSSEYSTVENAVEIQSLQMAAFMMTVCNVILVVTDWFVDLNLLRFMHMAEMLKPATPSHDGHVMEEYYPYIGLVLNKAERSQFSPECYDTMQTTVKQMMVNSKLKWTGGGLSARKVSNLPGLGRNTGSRVLERTGQTDFNLYLLPEMNAARSAENGGALCLLRGYQGHPGFDSLMSSLKKLLLSVPRNPLTHTTLSEKNWFHYAARTWDGVKKSQLISEYNRLLP